MGDGTEVGTSSLRIIENWGKGAEYTQKNADLWSGIEIVAFVFIQTQCQLLTITSGHKIENLGKGAEYTQKMPIYEVELK